MPEFREARLGDVADVRWGDTNTTKASYTPNGFTAFSASGPDGFLPHYDYDRTGIVLSAIGSECGKVWLARGRWSCIKNTIRFFSNDPQVRTEYLYWLSNREGFFPRRGSGQPFISQGDARDCRVLIPDIKTQDAICELLGSLNDKIDINRRMNETLEAMAQAIFRDWFVDFGPVRRRLAGVTDPVVILGGLTTAPAAAAELAALFPKGFDASDLPMAWDEEPVIEQANWVNGAAYKKMHFVPPGEGLPVIKIAELKAGVTSTTGFTNTDLGSRYRIDDGELLFSWSGNPDTSIDTFIWTGGPAWLNQHIFAVRPNGSRTIGFLFAMLKYLNPQFAEIARDKQTTGLGHVTKEDLKRLRVVVPSKAVEAAFDKLMTPIFQKLQAALLENRTLAETRDYLLPRLISGEVSVGDAALEIAA
ncbi:MAG: restriction endonuclease subunit S [Sphingobium sp.]|uniref:restriction endonuclease subunit S n=1 Tax=Sphingobium sp. TaxID=1912891 RepID=UPI0029AF54E9|nr:restriction endonuclease subunit S [Sphingobium sp.]MDX3908212.1 restriction endonuclease subunit S [Sphingobium sp.]